MTQKTNLFLAAAAIASVAIAFAPSAFAQSAPAKKATAPASAAKPAAAAPAPVAQPPLQLGPPIAGVCVFSQERTVGQSAAGQAAGQRMQQLRAQVTAELGPEKTALEADITAFRGQAATWPADQQQTTQQALAKRDQDLEQKAQLRQRELETTWQKALARINGELEPIVRAVVQAKTCSILFNADSALYAANPAMDISDAVVTQLNAKLPTITFDREIIDPATVQQQQH